MQDTTHQQSLSNKIIIYLKRPSSLNTQKSKYKKVNCLYRKYEEDSKCEK